jgi:hypothetical protein
MLTDVSMKDYTNYTNRDKLKYLWKNFSQSCFYELQILLGHQSKEKRLSGTSRLTYEITREAM